MALVPSLLQLKGLTDVNLISEMILYGASS